MNGKFTALCVLAVLGAGLLVAVGCEKRDNTTTPPATTPPPPQTMARSRLSRVEGKA